ncbi:Os02g0826032 [Oryza sativa Japonica Group]|uniref:Os02g0826032 protein n=1 Tax=Oryza sativa subsp. japonica TaxID=39947 RepID=A0A0N7KGD2_ORYSJ|nr:hypothetical protein EE612_014595 [Oryza sativa]BAS81689.1 Os02g0826032 [Oryza sativa Japonica Group]
MVGALERNWLNLITFCHLILTFVRLRLESNGMLPKDKGSWGQSHRLKTNRLRFGRELSSTSSKPALEISSSASRGCSTCSCNTLSSV